MKRLKTILSKVLISLFLITGVLIPNSNAYAAPQPITVSGYVSIYFGAQGSSFNNLILESLNQNAINSTFSNLKITLKHNATDSGTVYNGSDIFIPDVNGDLAKKDSSNIVKGNFAFSTADLTCTMLTISGAGYLNKEVNITLESGEDKDIGTKMLFPGDVGSLNENLTLVPDGKIDNIDFSVWLKTYKDNLLGTANPGDALRADFTKDGVVNNIDFSLWLVSYKLVLGGINDDSTPQRIKSVTNPADVVLLVGDDAKTKLPAKVTVTYDDNSTADVPVTWAAVDTTKPMAKTAIEGTIANTTLKASVNVTVLYVTPIFSGATAVNYREIDLTFNKALDKDSAQTAANYSVNNGSEIVIGKAVLLADRKTVRLTLQTSLAVQGDTNVKVLKDVIKDTDGLKIGQTTIKVVPFDVYLPALEKVNQVGKDRIMLTFSEPIWGTGTLILDNGLRSISPISISQTTTTPSRTFEVIAIQLPDGKHTLTVRSMKDFAGFTMSETTMEFDYAGVTDAPTATIKSAAEMTVNVAFSRPVKVNGLLGTGIKIYHTIDGVVPYAAVSMTGVTDTRVIVNGVNYYTEYVLTFNTEIIAGVPTSLYFKTNQSGTTNQIEDEYGNDVETATLVMTPTTDNVKPTAAVEATGDKTIIVKFSETVKNTSNVVDSNWPASALNPANYTLLDSAGVAVNNLVNSAFDVYGHPVGALITISGDSKTVTIILTNALAGSNYSLKVENIKDNAFHTNTMDAATISFTIVDKTNPQLTSAVINTQKDKIRVTFSEPMNPAGLTDTANYYYTLDGGTYTALPSGSSITILDDKTVIITLGTAAASTFGVGDNDTIVGLSSLKDLAGNPLGAIFSIASVIVTSEAISSDPISVVADKTFATTETVVFDVNTELSSMDVSKFSCYGTAAIGVSYVNHNGTATVTVIYPKIGGSNFFDARMGNRGGHLADIAAGAMTSVYGTVNGTITLMVTTLANGARKEDKIVPGWNNPSSASMDTDADGKIDHILVMFNEPIDPATFTMDKFTVSSAGYTYQITDAFVTGDTDGARLYTGGNYFGSTAAAYGTWQSNYGAPRSGAGTDGTASLDGGVRPAQGFAGQVMPVAGLYGYLTVKEREDVLADTDAKVNVAMADGIKDLNGNERAAASADIGDGAFPVVLGTPVLNAANTQITITMNEKVGTQLTAGMIQISRQTSTDPDNWTAFTPLAGATLSFPSAGNQVVITCPDLGVGNDLRAVKIKIVTNSTGKSAIWRSSDGKAYQMTDIVTPTFAINP